MLVFNLALEQIIKKKVNLIVISVDDTAIIERKENELKDVTKRYRVRWIYRLVLEI